LCLTLPLPLPLPLSLCRSSQEQQHAVQQLVSGVADSDLTLEELTPRLLQQVWIRKLCVC
jgi:hypothetical protein